MKLARVSILQQPRDEGEFYFASNDLRRCLRHRRKNISLEYYVSAELSENLGRFEPIKLLHGFARGALGASAFTIWKLRQSLKIVRASHKAKVHLIFSLVANFLTLEEGLDGRLVGLPSSAFENNFSLIRPQPPNKGDPIIEARISMLTEL